MSYTDPSGYFFTSLFKPIRKFVKENWRTIVAIGIAWWNPGALIFDSIWAASAATGFIAGGVSTGSLKGALIGAFSGAAFGGLHGLDPGIGKTLLHGAVGGVGSVLGGGKFGHGFVSAGLTQGLSGKINGISTKLGRIVASSVLGGTVSEITGGKFSNGAITAAFSRALNDEGMSKNDESNLEDNTTSSLQGESNAPKMCPVQELTCAAVLGQGEKKEYSGLEDDRDIFLRKNVSITGNYRCTDCEGNQFILEGTNEVSFWFESGDDLKHFNVEYDVRFDNSRHKNIYENPVAKPFNPADSGIKQLEEWAESRTKRN